MSLNGALSVGRSAILTSQAGLHVTGNNMANAATEGYHRRSVHLAPVRGQLVQGNAYVGQGVQIDAIRRELDTALQSRLRDSMSREQEELIRRQFLSSLVTLQNELTDNDISSSLSEFFGGFSELANNPEDSATRMVVIEQGRALASRITGLRSDYQRVSDEVDRSLGVSVDRVNKLLDEIAQINVQVTQSEFTAGNANALRDQRDLLIDEVAGFLDVTVIEQPSGTVSILTDSIPILIGSESFGIELRVESADDALDVSIRRGSDGTHLLVGTGRIGGLLEEREQSVGPALETLDTFASQLIFQVNRLHSQGQAQFGYESLEGAYRVADTTVNLNAGAAELPFRIENGSFFIHVSHQGTGQRDTYQIAVDGDADSLDDLIASINAAVTNVTAGTGLGNTLTLSAVPGYEISFSDDTSGALAALGVNTFFVGENAADIDVRQALRDNPNLLAVGMDHVSGSNGTALAIAALEDTSVSELNDLTLRDFWQQEVNSIALKANSANAAVDASRLVRENLSAQIQVVSGVSLDEESINLLQFQRQFQAAARFISVIDEMYQTLLSIA